MFAWLKKLWREAPPKEVIISNRQLTTWAENTKQIRMQKMQLAIDTCTPLLTETITNSEQKLTNLLNASLLNEKIPERHRHICDGNRQAYAERLRRLTSNLVIPRADDLEVFFTSTAAAMREFSEHSSRQKQVLSEFFAAQIKEVGSALLEIESIINQLKTKWRQEKIPEALALFREATDYQNAINQRDQLEEDALDTEKLAKQAEHQHTNANALAKEAEADSELTKLKEERAALNTKRQALEADLRERFAPLEVALRKYARLTPTNASIAEKYANESIDALGQDVHLKIIDILAEVQKLTWTEQLDLKQDKKNKVIIAIASLTKEYLRESISSYARLRKEEQQTSLAVSRYPASIEAAALKQDAEQARLRRIRHEQEAERLQKALARIDTDTMLTQFQKHAQEFLETTVRITQEKPKNKS